MGAFRGHPQKAQSLLLDVQIETRQNHSFPKFNHQPTIVSRENVGTLLFRGIMTPGALLTVVFGLWLWLGYGITGGWLYAKLVVVALLIAYHVYCGILVAEFARNKNIHGHIWFRWFNEVPVIFLVACVILVVLKPF